MRITGCSRISLIKWLVARETFNSYTEQTTLQLIGGGERAGASQENDWVVFNIQYKIQIQYKIHLRARAAKGCACSTMPGGEKKKASQMSARKNISIVF